MIIFLIIFNTGIIAILKKVLPTIVFNVPKIRNNFKFNSRELVTSLYNHIMEY